MTVDDPDQVWKFQIEAEQEVEAVTRVTEAKEQDPRAAMWFLERRWPERYAPFVGQQHTEIPADATWAADARYLEQRFPDRWGPRFRESV